MQSHLLRRVELRKVVWAGDGKQTQLQHRRQIISTTSHVPRIKLHTKWLKRNYNDDQLVWTFHAKVVFGEKKIKKLLCITEDWKPLSFFEKEQTHLPDLYLNINSKQLQFSHNCLCTRKLKSRMIDFCLSFCLLFAYYHFLWHRSVCSNHPLLKPLPLQPFQTLVSSNGHILFLWVWIDLYQQ